MSNNLNRRKFLQVSAATGLSLSVATGSVLGANDKVIVGVMGTGGRGTSLATSFAKQKGAEVAYVCDVQKQRAEKAAGEVVKAGGKEPKAVTDFRKVLDDRSVDVLVVATCNHW